MSTVLEFSRRSFSRSASDRRLDGTHTKPAPLIRGMIAGMLLVMAASPTCRAQVIDSLGPPPAEAARADRQKAAPDGQLGSTATLDNLHYVPAEQPVDEPPKDHSVLTLHAAEVPVPALKYRLWPSFVELKPGDAVTHFYRALVFLDELPEEAWNKAQVDYLENFEAQDPAEVRAFLEQAENVFAELEVMAYCENQRWDFRIRDLRGRKIYEYLLPDVQQSRGLARLISIRVHQQLADRDIEAALESIKIGFRLASFVGQGETLVQQLVGVAIAGVMLGHVETAIQMEECPNLYWALASLPRSLNDFRTSLEFEGDALFRIFPFLADAERVQLSDEQWKAELSRVIADLKSLSLVGGQDAISTFTAVTMLLGSESQVREAKARLIAAGRDSETLEGLGRFQILAMDTALELHRITDMMMKGLLLPPDKAMPVLERADESFEQLSQDSGGSPAAVLARLFLPAFRAAYKASVRTDFEVNRLMTIESIRSYLTTSDGGFPPSLAELEELPPMDDPYTDRLFEYQLRTADGEREAVLTGSEHVRWPPKQKTILRVAE